VCGQGSDEEEDDPAGWCHADPRVC
jgi:hypothetical protein